MKGDAKRKREEERKTLDAKLNIGSRVYSPIYGRHGTIKKVFKARKWGAI